MEVVLEEGHASVQDEAGEVGMAVDLLQQLMKSNQLTLPQIRRGLEILSL